jgi:hypothetical protein
MFILCGMPINSPTFTMGARARVTSSIVNKPEASEPKTAMSVMLVIMLSVVAFQGVRLELWWRKASGRFS